MSSQPASDSPRFRGLADKTARKLVQIGFLILFLYPLVPLIYKRLTFKPAPVFTSWLLPWDPLLFIGHLVHCNWTTLVIGAPLLLIALTLILGRFFCGWVCPLGTVLDLIRPIAFWQKSKLAGKLGLPLFPTNSSSPLRYYVLIALVVGGILSIQALGVLDPLVIFHRTATTLTTNALILQQPALRMYLAMLSLVLTGILILELWQPRFWCRHLCPLGALLSLFSRWSLLNRRVSELCNECGECRRYCPMRAIPKEGHDTDYAACHLCLGCQSACPRGAITFGFGTLAGRKWQSEGVVKDTEGKPRLKGHYAPAAERPKISRRELIGGLASGVAGLALAPVLNLTSHTRVIRPPGALPEDEFLRTCIICQECVRVCPTGGLKPTFLETGLAGIGTPRLIPLQGACSLIPSCPHLCAQVCPVGAIRSIKPKEMKIGVARVDHSLCLAWDQGVKCLVCVEACPNEAAQAYHGRVTVHPERCTGCGRCENACPVAGAAIHVFPLET